MSSIRHRAVNPGKPQGEPRIEGVMKGTTGFRILEEMGIRMMGVDRRPPLQKWGDSPCFLIFIVVHGRLFYPCPNAHPLRVKPGQALLLPVQAPKQVETHSEPVTLIWIHLEPDGLLFKALDLPSQQAEVRLFPQSDLIRAATETLVAEHRQQHPDGEEASSFLIRLVVHYLRRQLGNHESLADRTFRDRITRLMEDIRARPAEVWSVRRIAQLLNVSAGHLHRRVRELYAQTPADLVRGVRLALAAELLRTSNEKIEVIAARVGYSNAFNFSQSFLRSMGVRPGRYRQSLRE